MHDTLSVEVLQPIDNLPNNLFHDLEGQGKLFMPVEFHDGKAEIHNKVVLNFILPVFLDDRGDVHKIGVFYLLHDEYLGIKFNFHC